MCFMDWRIGRLIRSEVTTIPGLAGFVTFRPNRQRVGISFLPPPGNAIIGGYVPGVIQVAVSRDGVSFIGGTLCASDKELHFTLATHGELPTLGFGAGTPGGQNENATVIEYFAPESVLTLGLELLRREYPGLI